MTDKICDECETVVHCKKAGCIPKVKNHSNPYKWKKTKLDADYYISRIIKSKTPAELLKNQAELVLFLSHEFHYEQDQYVAKYKELLRALEH